MGLKRVCECKGLKSVLPLFDIPLWQPGLPGPATTATRLTGLTTATTMTAATGVGTTAAAGASGKKYTYKELEDLINSVCVRIRYLET